MIETSATENGLVMFRKVGRWTDRDSADLSEFLQAHLWNHNGEPVYVLLDLRRVTGMDAERVAQFFDLPDLLHTKLGLIVVVATGHVYAHFKDEIVATTRVSRKVDLPVRLMKTCETAEQALMHRRLQDRLKNGSRLYG